MAGWWLNLAEYPIWAVQLLDGDPVQVAAWLSGDYVHFYAAQTGALYKSREVVLPARMDVREESWQFFLEVLRAPNGAYLPVFDVGHTQIYTSHDGRLRLYQFPDQALMLDVDRRQVALVLDGENDGNAEHIIATGMDREFGSIAALNADGKLHIFQQQVYVGAFDVARDGVDASPSNVPSNALSNVPFNVFVPDAAGVVYLVGETHIRAVDMAGRVLHDYETPTAIGTAVCSPDGEWIVTGDREQAMIRLYDAELVPRRQHHARDLFENAMPVQLLASLPPDGARLDALAVMDDGTLALAMDGALCLTHIRELNQLPQPRLLF